MSSLRHTLLLALTAWLAGCANDDATRLNQRVVELQDSLRVYRDSLSRVQTYWTFNTVGSCVKMKDYEVKLGDTCMLEVFLTAGNEAHGYFRHEDPILSMTRAGGDGRSTRVVKNEGLGWKVSFVPDHVGEDSLMGQIVVPDQRGHADSVQLPFAVRYSVLPK